MGALTHAWWEYTLVVSVIESSRDTLPQKTKEIELLYDDPTT